MMRRDPMRTFAWGCVVIPYSIEARRAVILRDEQQRLTHWPGVITGASVTAFGILLLAIRKPEAARPWKEGA